MYCFCGGPPTPPTYYHGLPYKIPFMKKGWTTGKHTHTVQSQTYKVYACIFVYCCVNFSGCLGSVWSIFGLCKRMYVTKQSPRDCAVIWMLNLYVFVCIIEDCHWAGNSFSRRNDFKEFTILCQSLKLYLN